MRALATALSIALAPASGSALSGDAAAALGKQRAAASPLQWEVREASHPILGPIRFAHLKNDVVTPVGTANVYSSAYVSCEMDAHRIAIELTNQVAPTDPGGLRPAAMPRLVCNLPTPANAAAKTPDEIDAHWQVNEIGDAMARGLGPWALHSCSSIGVTEEIALPKGWSQPTATIRFEITPYGRELDAIFTTCGVMSAYGPESASPPLASSPRNVRPASADGSWRIARTIARHRSFVRARPDVDARVVVRLAANSSILVQRVDGEWWRVKSRYGWNWEGFIRGDRLVFDAR